MKRPPVLYWPAYRLGVHAAKNPPRFRKCPYGAGTVAATSWNRGTYDRDTGLPPLVAQLHTEIQKLCLETADLMRDVKKSNDAALRISQEAYESEERHVRTIARLNGELRAAENREREAQQHRSFVEDTAVLLERAHERGDDVEIDRLTGKLKRGW